MYSGPNQQKIENFGYVQRKKISRHLFDTVKATRRLLLNVVLGGKKTLSLLLLT